ncbi:GH18774 [Drosophila grimshawi]|uniref:GH18774 n=1 Tax=Drosophila grimshawi TaxID=7222 RepID=B4JG15_DROGR|nr:GH18774 [Drosophila grimshawi]
MFQGEIRTATASLLLLLRLLLLLLRHGNNNNNSNNIRLPASQPVSQSVRRIK